MSDTVSPDHFSSALEILSSAAISTDPVLNTQPPAYADESILICSLPDTPVSPSSTPFKTSSNGFHALPTRKPRSGVSRRGMGAKLRSYDSDEENKIVNPSSGHGKEDVLPTEDPKFTFLDILKMLSEEPSERFADTDILEVAAMKGINFPPPRWWKPGGYGSAEKISL